MRWSRTLRTSSWPRSTPKPATARHEVVLELDGLARHAPPVPRLVHGALAAGHGAGLLPQMAGERGLRQPDQHAGAVPGLLLRLAGRADRGQAGRRRLDGVLVQYA